MSVIISGVESGSKAEKSGIKAQDVLLTINGNKIADVLDFRFYQNERKLKIAILRDGKQKKFKIKKDEYEDIGLLFSTYLMDKQQSCKNKCIFCFIDQMPPGLRESLYFKDDDSRLSFLFGNYITLTNISEHEIERIIKMHISPINVSVHTTNPELRVKMMNNRFAGEALEILGRLNQAGIALNCQLVLCPGINDGDELRRSIEDLLKLERVGCVACVPVGITKYREGLCELKSYEKETSQNVIDIISEYQEKALKERGEWVVYAADEFYLTAERELPNEEFYGDFLQLENGVGLLTLFKSQALRALEDVQVPNRPRETAVITGLAASETLRSVVFAAEQKWQNLKCEVYPIINNFFGDKITVAGLLTGKDIYEQLKDKALPSEILIPNVMLRSGEDCFLDDVTVGELQEKLGVKIRIIDAAGDTFIEALAGESESEN